MTEGRKTGASGKLAELIERVQIATGVDRAIDDAVARAFYIEPAIPAKYDDGWDPPHYTASLDAVIGLVERELPGLVMGVRGYGDKWYADVHTDRVPTEWEDAGHKTPALALLLAFLRALSSRDSERGEA